MAETPEQADGHQPGATVTNPDVSAAVDRIRDQERQQQVNAALYRDDSENSIRTLVNQESRATFAEKNISTLGTVDQQVKTFADQEENVEALRYQIRDLSQELPTDEQIQQELLSGLGVKSLEDLPTDRRDLAQAELERLQTENAAKRAKQTELPHLREELAQAEAALAKRDASLEGLHSQSQEIKLAGRNFEVEMSIENLEAEDQAVKMLTDVLVSGEHESEGYPERCNFVADLVRQFLREELANRGITRYDDPEAERLISAIQGGVVYSPGETAARLITQRDWQPNREHAEFQAGRMLGVFLRETLGGDRSGTRVPSDAIRFLALSNPEAQRYLSRSTTQNPSYAYETFSRINPGDPLGQAGHHAISAHLGFLERMNAMAIASNDPTNNAQRSALLPSTTIAAFCNPEDGPFAADLERFGFHIEPGQPILSDEVTLDERTLARSLFQARTERATKALSEVPERIRERLSETVAKTEQTISALEAYQRRAELTGERETIVSQMPEPTPISSTAPETPAPRTFMQRLFGRSRQTAPAETPRPLTGEETKQKELRNKLESINQQLADIEQQHPDLDSEVREFTHHVSSQEVPEHRISLVLDGARKTLEITKRRLSRLDQR